MSMVHPHCCTHKVAESTKHIACVFPDRQYNSPIHLRHFIGRGHKPQSGHSPGGKQSSKPSTSVKCQETDFVLHFPDL